MKMRSTIYPERGRHVTRDSREDAHVGITVSLGDGTMVYAELSARMMPDGCVRWAAVRGGSTRGRETIVDWITDDRGNVARDAELVTIKGGFAALAALNLLGSAS